MKLSHLWQIAAGTSLTIALSTIAATPSVQAQAAYGSYIGVGPAIGLTEGDGPKEDREIAGIVNARYKFLELPISIRAQAFIGDGIALLPTVSYDIPLNWQTDAYIGIGPSVHISGNSPIGNKTSLAIQPGIDYALPNSNIVLFGNAVIAFAAYKEGGGTAASVQGGVGLRF
jgi:hypothetical protein